MTRFSATEMESGFSIFWKIGKGSKMTLTVLLAKLAVIWLTIDALLMLTIWYFNATIRPLFPEWWKNTICDDAPEYFD